MKPPKELLNSPYRRAMYKKSMKVLRQLEKVLPVSSVHLMGSFTTQKRRPADVDFLVLVKVKDPDKNSKWSADIAIAPDNEYGKIILEDAKKWMKQKYGKKKSAVIRLE